MTLEMDDSPSWRRRLSVALGLALVLPGGFGAWHLWVNRDRGARVGAESSYALAPGSGATAEGLQKILSPEGPGSAWRTPANRGTVQSVVMEPGTRRAWLATGTTIPVTRGSYLKLEAAW